MRLKTILLLGLFLTGTQTAPLVMADETYVFNEKTTEPVAYFDKAAWLTTEHPKIATFTTESNGNAHGVTTTGVPFKQYTIATDEPVRVQRFEIQDHFHFIVEGVIIGSLEALSVQLASVYNAVP